MDRESQIFYSKLSQKIAENVVNDVQLLDPGLDKKMLFFRRYSFAVWIVALSKM